jgi:hypothetical protein
VAVRRIDCVWLKCRWRRLEEDGGGWRRRRRRRSVMSGRVGVGREWKVEDELDADEQEG